MPPVLPYVAYACQRQVKDADISNNEFIIIFKPLPLSPIKSFLTVGRLACWSLRNLDGISGDNEQEVAKNNVGNDERD